MTFRELNETSLFKEYFESLARSCYANETTIQTRRYRMKKYAAVLWEKPWGVITKPLLLDWCNDLYENGTLISTRTKNAIISTVKQVSKHAYLVYDQRDIAKILKHYPLQLEDHKEIHVITYEEFCRMISYETNEEITALLKFLYFTGCRKGEARALRVEDYNPKTHKVFIYKSMRRYESSLKTTKTTNSRYVVLDEITEKIVRKQVAKNRKYIFGDKKPLTLTTLTNHFKKDLKLAGLPDNTIHSLRHSNVSLLWSKGVPIPEIAKRIGHTSPKITMEIYSHIFDVDQRQSINVLNSLNEKNIGDE